MMIAGVILLAIFAKSMSYSIDIQSVVCVNEVDGTRFQNPDSCTIFYHCLDGHAWEVECRDFMYYDPVTLECKPQKPDDPVCGLCHDLIDGDLVKGRNTCSNYGICKNKIVAEWANCENGYKFDTQENICKAEANCDPRCDFKNKQFLGDPNNCQNYLYCDNGNTKVYQCEKDLYYHSEKGFCSYKDKVVCAK